MPISREVKLLISSIVLIALAVVLAIQYTSVCRLQAVTLNGQPVDQWDQKLGLRPGQTVIRQPIDSLANALLQQQGITRVDIQYRLPNMLKISTNNLDPICYMIDRATGTFFGLDESGRVVSVDISQAKWDMPIFTGLRVRRMHDYTDDYRANLVIPQILELKRTSPSLYQSIEDVDFSRPNFVGLGFSGRSFRLKVPADRLLQRFDEFNAFVSRYHPPMDSASCFDLTYDDEIIRVGAVPQKKLPPIDTASINDKADFSDEAELIPSGTVDIPARAITSEQSKTSGQEGSRESARPSHGTAIADNENGSILSKSSLSRELSDSAHQSRPVVQATSIAAPTKAASGQGAPAVQKTKKSTAGKSKAITTSSTNSARPGKVTAAQGSKPAIKSHIASGKTRKQSNATAITPKGTAAKKSPAKKTTSKASQQK